MEGSGQVELTSSGAGTFDVSFPKRTAEEAGGTTSPEELIAAAHSSCFAMQLSAVIAEAGGTPVALEVSADVTLRPDPAGGLQHHHDRPDGPRRGRGSRRRRLPRRRGERQGHLPGEQGPDGHGDHPGRLARLTARSSRATSALRGSAPGRRGRCGARGQRAAPASVPVTWPSGEEMKHMISWSPSAQDSGVG